MKRKRFYHFLLAFFIFLFVYTAAGKMLDSRRHASVMTASSLPESLPIIVAGAELVVAGLLCSGKTRLWGWCGALLLLIMFTIYLGIMLSSGKPLPCSCGGVIESMTWSQHLVFNGVLILLAAAGYRTEARTKNLLQ